jgi:raffinose/stachyose/melibiose transport system substrate-binding protein
MRDELSNKLRTPPSSLRVRGAAGTSSLAARTKGTPGKRPAHRRASTLMIGIATTVGLCGASTSAADASVPAGAPTPVTVNWWGWTPVTGLAQLDIAAFNKQYPKIKVVYKNFPDNAYTAGLRPALLSGAGPDVFDVATNGAAGAFPQFVPYTINLTPAMEHLRGSNWQKGLYAPGITDFSQDGQLRVAQVGRVAAGFLWINLDLFNKYKLTAPTTLAQWVTVCKTFRSHGLGCFGEGVGAPGFDVDTLHTLVNSVDPGAFNSVLLGKIKWTSPAIVKGLALFKELSTDGILNPGADGTEQYPDINNAFVSGKLPMVQMGTWYQQNTVTSYLRQNVEGAGVSGTTKLSTFIPIPFPNVGGHAVTLFGDPDYGLAVSTNSKNKSAATTFALWLSSTKAGQQRVADNLDEYPVVSGVSANFSSLPLVDASVQVPALNKLAGLVNQVTQTRNADISPVMDTAIVTADQSVLDGQATPAQAAATLQQAQEQNPVPK